MTIIHVITWRYSDGSGSGAVCAHHTKEAAKRMIDILRAQCEGGRQFDMEPTTMEDTPPPKPLESEL